MEDQTIPLSQKSAAFDFDGDGMLDSAEMQVRNLYQKAEAEGKEVSKEDIFNIVKDQRYANKNARLFKRIMIVFMIMTVLLLCGTFGLVFVAVKLSKDAKVAENGQLQSTHGSNYDVSTLGAGNMGHVMIGDEMSYGGEILVLNDISLQYVGSIAKSTMESVWRQRQNGIQMMTAQVHYGQIEENGKQSHNWEVYGNIDRYLEDDRIVYLNFETTYYPDILFAVICYESSDLCAIASNAFSAPTPPSSNKDGDNHKKHHHNHENRRFLEEKKCDPMSPACADHVRRRMTVSPEVWQDEIPRTECWMVHYELSLYIVGQHFMLLMAPTTTTATASSLSFAALSSECPKFAVDVQYPISADGTIKEDGVPEKKVTFVSDDILDEYSYVPSLVFNKNSNYDQSNPLSFPLVQLVGAIDKARSTRTTTNSSTITAETNNVDQDWDYDFLTNSCVTIILDVLFDLGIDIDDTTIDFVTDELLENSPSIHQIIDEKVKESSMAALVHYFVGDRGMVKDIVEAYVKNHEDDMQQLLKQEDL